jgi:cell pole-organizing protein PopZ
MLQPMLKVWLDDNLPGIVERLVRVEIEQISFRPRAPSPTSHSN